jgi:hypothetical protein
MEGKMITMILIGKPESLHIPYFAMPSPHSKVSSWHYPNKKSVPLSQLVGGNACRWIIEKQKSFDIRRISTRNYIPPQTAFYANWLIFFDKALANELISIFPHLDSDKYLEVLKNQLSMIEAKVTEKLNRGAYDLSRYPADQRLYAAQRFIDLSTQSRNISDQITFIQTAMGLRDAWSSIIDQEIRAKINHKNYLHD